MHTNHTFISIEMCSKNSTHAIAHQFFMRWEKKKNMTAPHRSVITEYYTDPVLNGAELQGSSIMF